MTIPDPDLLVQVHIPRSAGTSVSYWLRDAARQGWTSGHAAVYPAKAFLSDADLELAEIANPRVTTVSAHDIRLFPERLCGRTAHYFTIVREPFDHFASFVRYMLRHREDYRVPRSLHEQRDVAAWFLDARYGEFGNENMQTNHLALHAWCRAANGRCEPGDYTWWSNDERTAYWNARFGIATAALATFLCVGVFDRLPESLAVLRTRAADVGIRLLSVDALPSVNRTERADGDLRWMERGTDLGEAIAASLSDDLRLYAYACEALDRATEIKPAASPHVP